MDELVYPRQQALENPECTATVIHAILRDKYGEEAYDWDPVTIYLEVKADFNADMCAEAVDRWCAIQVVMGSDAFFKRLDAFMGVCNTLADGSPFFGAFNPVTLEEAAWALTEVALNRELLPFSYPIKQYLKMILKQDGYAENQYPAVFNEVFGPQPDAAVIREGLATVANDSNIDQYVNEQLGDLVSQFNKIPDLKQVDNLILERGFEEALGNVGNGR